jgi:hypothetical protein
MVHQSEKRGVKILQHRTRRAMAHAGREKKILAARAIPPNYRA